MKQEWINKIMSCDLNSIDTIGRTNEDDKKDAWALRYIAAMVELGIPLLFAIETYSCGDHDYEIDPRDAASDEISYWE